jgi:hypothetical protein
MLLGFGMPEWKSWFNGIQGNRTWFGRGKGESMPRKHFAYLILIVLFVGAPFSVAKAAPSDIDISPIFQETPVWCWAAVAEMVLNYYDIPDLNPMGDFQCAIAALVHPACLNYCRNCITNAPNMSYMRDVLQNYPAVAANYSQQSANKVLTNPPTGILSKAQVTMEIDADRPIVVGISPSGFTYGGQPQHVSLIVGYEDSDDDNFLLTVNDPFPYGAEMFSRPNPYVAAGGAQRAPGQYSIKYETFRDRMHWSQSLAGIRTSGTLNPPHASVCVTPVGTCRMAIQMPKGQSCACPSGVGPIQGVTQ